MDAFSHTPNSDNQAASDSSTAASTVDPAETAAAAVDSSTAA